MDVGESTLDVGEQTVGETTRRRNDWIPVSELFVKKAFLGHFGGF